MEGLRTRNGNAVHRSRFGQKRPRTPGVAYAVLTVNLAVLIGALALTARQTAPPTIAEFAPQAVAQITDTAEVAGGREGETERSAVHDETTRLDAISLQTVDVARVRQCVGDPPRQIEDPQSPPCVPYWSGDNGGATSRGVTRDEIRLTVRFSFGSAAPMEAFFNRRFEFYGRQVRLMPRAIPSQDAAGQRAAARAAYEEDQAFASTADCDNCHAYYDELARLGIVGVHYAAFFPETYLASRSPYVWTYPMANDRLFASAGNWYCARFAGRNAVHAGDPLLQTSRRKLGIVLTQANWEGTSVEPMNEQLASCGGRTSAVIHSSVQTNDAAADAALMENAMLQMKAWGVTTVACLCEVDYVLLAMPAATNQGYFPEWLLTSYISNEASAWARVFLPAEQRKSLMLLLAHPMEREHADHPSNWAVEETSGAVDYPSGTVGTQWLVDIVYWELLLIAAGVQLAGPYLTPDTFERGLHRASFPNPAHRIMAGAVGFDDGDHSMTEDAAEIWWSNTAQSPYPEDGPGAFCYVDHGARRRIGAFPTDDPFFNGACDNGTA